MTGQRTYVVTGAASGIGAATKAELVAAGHRVIGIDLAGSDIDADLSSDHGRSALAAAVGERTERIDAVIAVAGVALPNAVTVRVNYFGAIATLERLLPMLRYSNAPRAAVVASFSALQEGDPELLELLRGGDEDAAVARAGELASSDRGHLVYASTKRAIAEWVRSASITADWAGAGIPLNAVGPGIILTPMTRELLATPEGRDQLMTTVPMPLNGPAEAATIARTLTWFTDAGNTHITGQTLFVDGGADASIRGPRVFD